MYMPPTTKTTAKQTASATSTAKKAATKKAAPKKKATADVVVAAPVVAEPVVAAPAATETPPLESVVKLQEFGAKIQQLTSLLAALKQDYKTLDKTINREMKVLQKHSRKRKPNANRAPSGFVKPTLISTELAKFLGKDDGTEMARTEVSKEINQYIRAHSLQDKDNGRIIKADAKLKKLLNLNDQDQLTYFNLQRYMKHHFIKTDGAVATSASASA